MRQTLTDLLTSKKFLAALAAIIVYIAGRFGLDIDPAKLDPIWQILLVYVGAQGVADLGKSSAQARAAADATAKTLGVLALVVLVACGPTAKSVESAAGHAVVNCTAQAIGTTPALDLATALAITNKVIAVRAKCTPPGGSLDWSCVEADAIADGKVIGGCTLVQLITGATSKQAVASAAAGPDPGRAALASFRARVAPLVTYRTASGDL